VTLPNFLFIGPDKSGSSWIQKVLRHHVDVFLPPAKDIYFFDQNFDKGVGWYERYFRDGEGREVIGEICHDYLFHPEVPMRIRGVLGADVKLMVCLREPVERSYSAYLNMRKNGWEIGTFDEAVRADPTLLGHGQYGTHLSRFYEVFPKEQIYIGIFDDLRKDPVSFLNSLTDWLQVPRLELHEKMLQPERAASYARSARTARVVKRAAILARGAGLAHVVGKIKSNPVVQSMLYREYGADMNVLAPEVVVRYRDLLRPEVAVASELTGIDMLSRWGY
jgi:hypothetical protein